MDEKAKLKYFYFNRFAHLGYNFINSLGINPLRDSIPLKTNEDYNPFFIVGSGRSGNTLLRRVLTSQEGVVIPPETYVLGKILQLHSSNKHLSWDLFVNLILSTFQYHPEFYTFGIDSLLELAKKIKKVDREKRSLAFIIDAFYKFYAEKKDMKCIIWGDKTPTNALHVYQIKKLFPNAKFIHMIRNGLDVANSYKNAKIYSSYELGALRWKKSVNYLLKFGQLYPENYVEIRYEDLVKDPESEAKRICQFLGIPFKQKMIKSTSTAKKMGDVAVKEYHKNVLEPINTKSIGKGKIQIDKEEKLKLTKYLNKTLETLGYEKV